jgi:hypothetical protein
MRYLSIILLVFLYACGNEKIVQLAEITHSEITEIKDVSAAYLFYDETQPDSVELNRKNLISTTNWLVNVDKRLTLEQAIPQVIYLQDKKRNAEMHKNEDAKNYYTCNDTSIKNLGFIEFTDVFYHEEASVEYVSKITDLQKKQSVLIHFNSSEKIEIIGVSENSVRILSNKKTFINDIMNLQNDKAINIVLNFNKTLSFQDYITFKSLISELKSENITIDNNEFIY